MALPSLAAEKTHVAPADSCAAVAACVAFLHRRSEVCQEERAASLPLVLGRAAYHFGLRETVASLRLEALGASNWERACFLAAASLPEVASHPVEASSPGERVVCHQDREDLQQTVAASHQVETEVCLQVHLPESPYQAVGNPQKVDRFAKGFAQLVLQRRRRK